MAGREDHQIQEALDFEGRREWLSKPPVRKLLVSLACRRLGLTLEAAEDLVQHFYSLKLDPVARAYEPARLDPALVVTSFIRFGQSKLGRKPAPVLLSTDDPNHSVAVQKALEAPAVGAARGPGDPGLLSRAIGRLPNWARSRIDAFYVQELSHSEMAQREGKTIAAIKISLHRARQLLRHHYMEEALALTISDISSFSTLLKTIASNSSMPSTPIGLIFSLLPPVVQTSVINGAVRDSAEGTDNIVLLRAFNDLLRSERLDEWPCLKPIVTSLKNANDADVTHSILLRNRQILEVVFEPLIRKFAYASVI